MKMIRNLYLEEKGFVNWKGTYRSLIRLSTAARVGWFDARLNLFHSQEQELLLKTIADTQKKFEEEQLKSKKIQTEAEEFKARLLESSHELINANNEVNQLRRYRAPLYCPIIPLLEVLAAYSQLKQASFDVRRQSRSAAGPHSLPIGHFVHFGGDNTGKYLLNTGSLGSQRPSNNVMSLSRYMREIKQLKLRKRRLWLLRQQEHRD